MIYNPLIFPTLGLALLLAVMGVILTRRVHTPAGRAALWILGSAAAVPAVLFSAYYFHVLDNQIWLYNLRAATGSELLASGAGFIAGFALIGKHELSGEFERILRLVPVSLILLMLIIPYIKPIVLPVQTGLIKNQWDRDVCLQSTASTCGPCSSATLLRRFNISSTEKQIAEQAYSSYTGTEIWYLARVLRRHGLRVTMIMDPKRTENPPVNSIAGVTLGKHGPGHFITVLDETPAGFLIGDPLSGPELMTKSQIHKRFVFTGFFLIARSGK